MSQKRAGQDADSERLPWLEPYKQPLQAQRRQAARSHGPLLAYAFGLLVLSAVGIGGYWLGQRGSVAEQPKRARTPAPVWGPRCARLWA